MSDSNMSERMRCKALEGRVTSAEEAAKFVDPNTVVGCSGFTPSGYPKVVPTALAKRAEAEGPIPITLWTGASVGPELEEELVRTHCTQRRFPYQTGEGIRKGVNEGEIHFADLHLSHNAQNLRYGFHGDMDVAIIEALAITEEGHIIPTTSVGNAPVFVELAKKVIVEINHTQPLGLEGIHDIYSLKNPPHREPIPITNVRDRIGTPWIPCDPNKIMAIVSSDVKDCQRALAPVDEVSHKMAMNLLDFLSAEVNAGKLPKGLLPLQSGVGNVANAVLVGLQEWPTDGLTVYTEVLQDAVFDLLASGKVAFASSTALTPSPDGAAKFYPRLNEFKDRVILRPQEISNHPEVIRRLGLIAMNTAQISAFSTAQLSPVDFFILSLACWRSSPLWAMINTRLPVRTQSSVILANTMVLPVPVGSTSSVRLFPFSHSACTAARDSSWYGRSSIRMPPA